MKHAVVTLVLMLLSAGAAVYTVDARYADERGKDAQTCIRAARRVRDKDQQRCYRAIDTHNRDLCDWQAAQATEPWEGVDPRAQ